MSEVGDGKAYHVTVDLFLCDDGDELEGQVSGSESEVSDCDVLDECHCSLVQLKCPVLYRADQDSSVSKEGGYNYK